MAVFLEGLEIIVPCTEHWSIEQCLIPWEFCARMVQARFAGQRTEFRVVKALRMGRGRGGVLC